MPYESLASENERLMDEVNLTRWTSEEDCHHLRSTSRPQTTFVGAFTQNTTKCQVFGILLLVGLVTYITFNYITLQQYPTENDIMEKLIPTMHHRHASLSTAQLYPSTTHNPLPVKKQSSKPAQPNVSMKEQSLITSTTQEQHKSSQVAADAAVPVRPVKEPMMTMTYAGKADDMACHFPHLNPSDPSIQHIISVVPKKPKCPKENYLYDFDYEKSSLVKLPLAEGHSLWTNCCYKAVFRGSNTSDDVERFSNCYSLEKWTRISIPDVHEFVTIFCDSLTNSTIKSKMIQGFAHVSLKPGVEERVRKYKPRVKKRANLVILGWDGVSHMNFLRTLPTVRKYLVEDLSAFWFDGYTKVGDNTYPNLAAVTTGHSREELDANCSKSKYFDDCPFFWSKFAEQGYRTSYAEDSASLAWFEFRRQPVDYYFRPFASVAEKHIGLDKKGNTRLCYGPQLSLQILVNYMKSLSITMGKNKRYAELVWSNSLTHDYLTYGSLGEEVVLEYVKWMHQEGHLNQTVFVFMSDHGIRWGSIRDTPQGKIEDNMPFLYFVLPQWLKENYPMATKNFQLNRNRLTTPFDTHETFMDILELSNIEDKSVIRRTKELEGNLTLPRGISLFLPIPKSRTCQMATIDDHWCVCNIRKTVPLNGSEVRQGANYAVFHLNKLISKYETEKCAYLTLKSVRSAKVLLHGMEDKKLGKGKDTEIYELGFVTSPGDGSFDATVIREEKRKWKVSGTISRTNLYGNQSYCVENKDMKKYCYCLILTS